MARICPFLNISYTSPGHRNMWWFSPLFDMLADISRIGSVGHFGNPAHMQKSRPCTRTTGFRILVLVTGIEPATYCLQDSCATVAPHQL